MVYTESKWPKHHDSNKYKENYEDMYNKDIYNKEPIKTNKKKPNKKAQNRLDGSR